MERSKRLVVVNSIGLLSYLASLLLWAWVGILYVTTYSESALFKKLIPENTNPVIIEPARDLPGISPFQIFIAALLLLAGLLLFVYLSFKMISSIGKGGQKITRASAHALIPVIHHEKQPVSYRQGLKLTNKLVFYTKFGLIVLPILATLAGYRLHFSLDINIALIVTCFLALIATLLVTTQLLLASLLKIDRSRLW